MIVGGVLGHAICTGLAVIGGRMIAQRISVRTGNSVAFKLSKVNILIKCFITTVTLVGGVVFLLFALSALFFSPDEEKPAIDP